MDSDPGVALHDALVNSDFRFVRLFGMLSDRFHHIEDEFEGEFELG
jgi:hypothetical protein